MRSSRPELFCKNGVLANFAKFTRKHQKDIPLQMFSCEFCEISLFLCEICCCSSLRSASALSLHCTKKDTITSVFLQIYLYEFIFSCLLFFRKDRSSHRICPVKKGILKNCAIFHKKTPMFESLLDKIAGF